MEPLASPPVKPEPKLEASRGGVKPEPSDVLPMSQIPYRRSETTASATPGDVEPEETDYLERLCNENTLDSLETGISISGRLLNQLQDALSTYTSPDVDNWMKAILDLEKRTAPTRTVVGVVGNTGAGKSSVINAVLDEERSVRFFLLSPLSSCLSFAPTQLGAQSWRGRCLWSFHCHLSCSS